MPPLLIYTEPVIRAERPAHAPDRPTWVLRGTDRYYPAAGPIDYPVHQRLALHLLDSLRQQGFGAAPAETNGAAMGHAFAFICTQLMRRTQVPIVPVLLNALYPPTQPDPEQCLRIGTAMAHAIAAFPADARVGIVASGGLSHFVVDETFDRLVVQALSHDDQSALAALPDHKLQSGSGEIRNWICAAGALRSLAIDRIDYLPGYRTRAGTGTGLCFAVWR
jgi:3-O-methylgallate 3,4-dioxygenase